VSKPRLLLADDSLTIQKLVNLTFADEGFDVITVGDGESALREIGSVQPDIVLADVNMPGPTGYEICSMMRSIEETANTPVILLVGSFEKFDEAEAERVGASTFVTKPFQSIRQFVEQVKDILDQTKTLGSEGHAPFENEVSTEEPAANTSDIDSLYEQSFAETVEMPAAMAAAMYARDGFDDEMLETSYSADQESTPAEFAVTDVDDSDFDNGHSVQAVADPDTVQEFEEYQPPVYDDIPSEPSETESSVAAMAAAPTEEFRHDMSDPFASTAEEFDLDEIDLLDLTPGSMTETVEFTTPAAAAEQGSRSQVVSLSPELLDIIVQRVVEKLSEKY